MASRAFNTFDGLLTMASPVFKHIKAGITSVTTSFLGRRES